MVLRVDAGHQGNQKEYPQPFRAEARSGFPMMRFVVIFALAVGTCSTPRFCPYQGEKRTAKLALFRRLPTTACKMATWSSPSRYLLDFDIPSLMRLR